MCYLLKNVYIFNNEGKFIYLADANETSIIKDDRNNYIINAYKKENCDYYYTIITLISVESLSYLYVLQMFYYKINLLNYKKELIYYNKLKIIVSIQNLLFQSFMILNNIFFLNK